MAPLPDVKDSKALDNATKLHEVLATRTAPAATGKPFLENDLGVLKSVTGITSMKDFLGCNGDGDGKSSIHKGVNFGSKKESGGLPDDVRLRLLGFKKMISSAIIQAQLMTKLMRPSANDIMATSIFKNHLGAMLKAFNVTDFATWIPDVHARFYFEEYEIAALIPDLFDQLPMDSASVNIEGALGYLFGLLETDTATFAEQSNTSAEFNVVSRNNVVHTKITEDLNQDSAPAIIDKLRKEVVAGIARSEERAILNGDTTGTHMDADVTAATDFRKAFKGLRKLALDNSANGSVVNHGGDAPSKLMFANMFNAMGKYTDDVSDLAWLLPVSVANAVITGAIPELFTAFAFGGPASNRTGQMPPIFGVEGYKSQWQRQDLHETGVYTIAAQTKCSPLLVKKSRIMRFQRAPIRVWAAPSLPSSDIMLMSAKKRHSFAAIPQSAEEKSIIVAINVETQA